MENTYSKLSDWVKKIVETNQNNIIKDFLIYPQKNGKSFININQDFDRENLKSSLEEVFKEKVKWIWLHICLNDSKDDIYKVLSCLEMLPKGMRFSRIHKVWSDAQQSEFSQQPFSYALNDWDFFEIKIYPHQYNPSNNRVSVKSSGSSWDDWSQLARLEADKGAFCIRYLVHTNFVVTFSPLNLSENFLLKGEHSKINNNKNPFPLSQIIQILMKLSSEEQEYLDEPNAAFLLQNTLSVFLDQYDLISHALEKTVDKQSLDQSLNGEFLNKMQSFEIALAHLTKMQLAYSKLFDHFKNPERGAFQGKISGKAEIDDQGVSVFLEQRSARTIRFLDEIGKRIITSRELYFNLLAKRTNDFLARLTLVTVVFSVAFLITGFFGLNTSPYSANSTLWYATVFFTLFGIIIALIFIYMQPKK